MRRFLGVIVIVLLFFPTQAVLAAPGCCSHHGGVDYCDTSSGRYVCKDGTYSPTCKCTYIPPKSKSTPPPPPPTCKLPVPIKDIKVDTKLQPDSCDTYDLVLTIDDDNSITSYKYGIFDTQTQSPTLSNSSSSKIIETKSAKAGKKYIYVAPTNSCGKSTTFTKEIEINLAEPKADLSVVDIGNNDYKLTWTANCTKNLSIAGIGDTLSLEKNSGSRNIKIGKNEELTFTALGMNGKEIKTTKALIFTPQREDPPAEAQPDKDPVTPMDYLITYCWCICCCGTPSLILLLSRKKSNKKKR